MTAIKFILPKNTLSITKTNVFPFIFKHVPWRTLNLFVFHVSLGEKETVYFLNSIVFQQICIFKEQYLESRTQDTAFQHELWHANKKHVKNRKMAIMERQTNNVEPFPKRKVCMQDPVTGKVKHNLGSFFAPGQAKCIFWMVWN